MNKELVLLRSFSAVIAIGIIFISNVTFRNNNKKKNQQFGEIHFSAGFL